MMRGYSEYKDSGIDWMGKIPNHWSVIPVKGLYQRIKRTNFPDAELLSVYRDYGVIPKSSRDDNNNKESDDLTPYQLVKVDDLVMNKMKAWQGSIAVSGFEGIVSPAYYVYTPRKLDLEIVYPRYVHYLLRNPIYITQYMARSKGIRVNQWDLDAEAFERIEILLPPKSEQEEIYSFLDRETARIDNLIAEKQTFIKLLKEKRQALISHEFRADNKHHRAKLGYFVDLLPGYAFKSELFSESSSDIRLLRGANVGVGSLKWDDVVYWSLDNQIDVEAFALKEGDIVFGMDRPWINAGARAAIVRQEDLPCYLVQRVARIRAKPNVNQKYIYFALASEEFKVHAEADLTGLSVPHISPDQIKSFPIPVLTQEEQDLMVSNIERNTSRIDSIVEEAEQSIILAMEHRTALISSAVTGKIDVRKTRKRQLEGGLPIKNGSCG